MMKAVQITDENGNSISLTGTEFDITGILSLVIDAVRAIGYTDKEVEDEIKFLLSEQDFAKLESCKSSKKCKK